MLGAVPSRGPPMDLAAALESAASFASEVQADRHEDRDLELEESGRVPRVHVVLRILRAELARSFSSFRGCMAPFAEICWPGDEGVGEAIARSRPHRGGHLQPAWDYECLHTMHYDRVKLSSPRVNVLVNGVAHWATRRPTLCGSAVVGLGDLLWSEAGPGPDEACAVGSGLERVGPVRQFTLEKRGERTGTIWIQAELLRPTFPPSADWQRSDLRLSRQLRQLHAEAVGEAVAAALSSTGKVEGGPQVDCQSSKAAATLQEPVSLRLLLQGDGQPSPPLEPEPNWDVQNSPARRRTRRRATFKVDVAASPTSTIHSAGPNLLSSMRTEDFASEQDTERYDSVSPAKTLRSMKSLRSLFPSKTKSIKYVDGKVVTRAEDMFDDAPVCRLGTSGGTAPFFRLQLRAPLKPFGSLDYYIGKDLSHAKDEVGFYEAARELMNGTASVRKCFQPLLDFLLDYAGVYTSDVAGAEAPRELLVMRNMRDGYQKLRMLDIKIGEKTASAGWQGKSRMAAIKQDILDGLTNSKGEGFRLEGFDGPPPSLLSMNPLLDALKLLYPGKDVKKKAYRFMLQRKPATEVFMHLLDVHQEPGDVSEADLRETLSPSEAAELALHEICCRLAKLALACRQCPIPQKWVGSSVALGFESGQLPSRKAPESELREKVLVKLFDWGRSELNTPESHAELEEQERQDRATFWRYYMGGIDSLAWEAARCYRHRFGCANGWFKVDVVVYDFDSLSESDFIGQVSLHLRPTEETTVRLLDKEGREVRRGLRSAASLTFRIDWRCFPDGSRLSGAWRVTLVRAENLPGLDWGLGRSTSDPFAVLTAVSQDGRFRFRQQTCVAERQLDPVWEETFELPVAADPSALHTALNSAVVGLGAAPLGAVLIHEDAGEEQVDQAFGAWAQRLDTAASCMALTAVAAAAAARKELAEWDQFSSNVPPPEAPAPISQCLFPCGGSLVPQSDAAGPQRNLCSL